VIVRTTPQLDVLDARLPAGPERLDAALDEAALVATPSIPANERAPALVPLPDHAPHGGGDVARAPLPVGRRAAGRAMCRRVSQTLTARRITPPVAA
jgi:hypothetical protein